MACILHDLEGLLHGQMAIYYVFTDLAPVFILGATEPIDESKWPLAAEVRLPNAAMQKAPAPMAADLATLEAIVETLLHAERPWIMPEFAGRQSGNFDNL